MTPRSWPNTPVFYRHLRRSFPLIRSGEGVWLVDEDGKRYLDAAGGAFVANIGHGVPEIGAAMAAQASRVAYVNGTAFTNEGVEALAAHLVARAPSFQYAYVLGSGSEAVEAALKMARQHWVDRDRATKHVVIALTPSYHGNTMLALSASARAHYQAYWREWLVDVQRIPAPYAYRCPCNGNWQSCDVCTGAVLEEAIVRIGAERVAAFIVEPVGGSSTGHNVPRGTWLRNVREICTRHDVLLVADEVLCGAGRTGTWTAMERAGVSADIMTMGKGISGGYAPVSAVLATHAVVEPIAQRTGYLMHAQTFSHHAVTCAAAVATLEYLDRHALVARCAALGAVLHERLQELREHAVVGDIRGVGLLAGIEFVADRETHAPLARGLAFTERVAERARERGLVVWPNPGHLADGSGDLICLAPPFTISEPEIDTMVRLLSSVLSEFPV